MQQIIHIAGSIVVWTALAGVLIVVLELIWYTLPAGKRDNRRKRVALITGATSGLGKEYALRIDKKCRDLDEIWLVGRRENLLKEAAGELEHPARCLVMDLTDPEKITEISDMLAAEDVNVRWLINCAGAGRIGEGWRIGAAAEKRMIDLNCTAAVSMADVCIPHMGSGSILANVCSTAAFQPLQYLNAYASTKAFLLRYTRALRRELLPRKIRVSAVCPYWIRDTEFIAGARGLAENGKAVSDKTGRNAGAGIKGFPFAQKVRSVAAVSLAGIRLGLPVVTPGIVCTMHRVFAKVVPEAVMGYVWDVIRRM